MSEEQISELTKIKDEQITKLNKIKDLLKQKLVESKQENSVLKKELEDLKSSSTKQIQQLQQTQQEQQSAKPPMDIDSKIDIVYGEISNLIENSQSEIIASVSELILNIKIDPALTATSNTSTTSPNTIESVTPELKPKSEFPSPSERLKQRQEKEKLEREEYEKSKPKPKSEFLSPSQILKKKQQEQEEQNEPEESEEISNNPVVPGIQTIARPNGPSRCPKCKSLEIKEETDKSQTIGFGMFGKKYYCKKCRTEWKYKD